MVKYIINQKKSLYEVKIKKVNHQ